MNLTQQELADRLAIDDVLTRYATALDTHDYELLDEVFAADASLDYSASAPGGVRGSRDEVRDWLRETMAEYPIRQHSITNRRIELSGDTAVVHSYFYNPLGKHDADGRLRMLFVGGSYRDRFERRPEGWRIVERVTEQAWYDA